MERCALIVSTYKFKFMKTDLYTKVILTIIAVALTANLLKSTITPAMADSKRFVSVPVNPDGSINVRLSNAGEPMDINIKKVDTYAFSYISPIPVKEK